MIHIVEIVSCDNYLRKNRVIRNLVTKIDGVKVEFKVIRHYNGIYQFRPQTQKDVTKHPDWVSIRKHIGIVFREWAVRNQEDWMGDRTARDPLKV